ncbi:amidohydrolase [Thermocrinis minervae]|uniref:5-methylthioadenosine/S-adenosylhomocysteine deaminase n=1 Tax=Thermocrinis minervae TaxID=381751 RepID=A0A1M6RH00_9AQUI|nr:amidohydrolase [Thermocrinis minervae]SHK31713.1 5-methylthioadenosine/S-adenosylhomocysteine deaminase [Thermocrinis minervae]
MFDLLIKDAQLPGKGRVNIGIKDGVISYVGDRESHAKEIIHAHGKYVFPAFANMHTHISMSLLRGIGADFSLKDWLEKVIWPLEGKFVSPEFVRDGALLGIAESILSGTTLLMDMYFFEEEIGAVAQEVGIRIGLGFGILDFPTKVAKTQEEYIKRAREFVKVFKGAHLVFPVLCPHAPYTCGPSTLLKIKELADEENLYIHIHVAETKEEVERIRETYGKTPVMHLESLGFLSDRVICAHMVWLSEEERQVVKERNVKVVHCPESNLKLASGIAPVWDYVRRGIHVCLGTDGPASNDNLDMLEETSTMVKLQRGVSLDPKAMDSETALRIATYNGFSACGIKAGKVEEGYEADLILVDMDKPHLQPLYDPVAQLIYSAKSSDIDTVICKGKVLMEKRELKTIDMDYLRFIAKKWREQIESSLRSL